MISLWFFIRCFSRVAASRSFREVATRAGVRRRALLGFLATKMAHVCGLPARLAARWLVRPIFSYQNLVISTGLSCAILLDLHTFSFLFISERFVQQPSKMNRIIIALAALVGQATAFAPAVAPRPATQLQASKFDAGAKAAASLAASLALAGAVLTPEAAFAAAGRWSCQGGRSAQAGACSSHARACGT